MTARARKLFWTWTPLILFLLLWNYAITPGSRYAFLLGRPAEIVAAAQRLVVTGSFWADFAASLEVLLTGFVVGASVGFVVGLIVWQTGRGGQTIERYLSGLGSIPLFAVAPLLIFTLGIGLRTRIFIVTISVLIPMAQASLAAAKDMERRFADLLAAFRGTRWQELLLVVAPGAFYSCVPMLKPSVNAALVAVFLSEWISAENGLAKFVLASMSIYAVPDMWVGLLSFVILGILLTSAVDFAETSLTHWRRN